MKFAVVILVCVAAASAQYNAGRFNKNPYNPFAKNKYQPTPAPFRTYAPIVYPSSTAAPLRFVDPVVKPVVKYQNDERNAETLKYGNEVNPDGSYTYFYETNNGIAAQAQGTPRNYGGNPPAVANVVEGSFSWTAPDGQPIYITYVADENGYKASGNAIPTSPPVPAQIARALAYIAKNSPQK